MINAVLEEGYASLKEKVTNFYPWIQSEEEKEEEEEKVEKKKRERKKRSKDQPTSEVM